MLKIVKPTRSLKNLLNTKFRSPTTLRSLSTTFSRLKFDAEEVAKFDDLAKNHWDPNGPSAPLHQMNQVRVPFIRHHLTKITPSENYALPLKDLQILDLGCGAGILSEPLARLGADVVGLDASKEMIEIAKKRQTHRINNQHDNLLENIQYIPGTVEDFITAFPDYHNYFDLVVSSEVIEHVPDPISFVECISKLTDRESGIAILSTMNRTNLAWLTTIVGAEYVLNMIPRGTHDWDKYIKPEEMDDFAKNVGMANVETSGMFYNPVTGEWTLVDDQSVNYISCFKF